VIEKLTQNMTIGNSSLIVIFGVLSYSSPEDWQGENHTDEITQLFQSYR
jgi:hypothetical protein